MNDKKTTIENLKIKIQKFVKDRDWEQYHNPKNLSMSIAIEAAELMENFQWDNAEASLKVLKSKHNLENIEDEIADIAIYIIDFCNMNGLDLAKIIKKKLLKNKRKYPIKLCKGRATKYNQFRSGK